MKWHDATKVLPASDTAVLVRDGDDKCRYVLCHLFGNGSYICFYPINQDVTALRSKMAWCGQE